MVCMHVQAVLLERHDRNTRNFAISNVSDSLKPVFILIGGETPQNFFQISLKMLNIAT